MLQALPGTTDCPYSCIKNHEGLSLQPTCTLARLNASTITLCFNINQPTEDIMHKLLAAYKANPTEKNAQRLLAYADKHPFASILLMPEDQALIARLMCHQA